MDESRETRSAASIRIRDYLHGYRDDGAPLVAIRFSPLEWATRTRERGSSVKLRHYVFLAIFAVGALYIWHNYSAHGGVGGIKQGIGLG